jgi:hypothetical protein
MLNVINDASEIKFASPSMRATPSGGGRANPMARRKWFGCSPINDFEMLEKVGEGTFGYGMKKY